MGFVGRRGEFDRLVGQQDGYAVTDWIEQTAGLAHQPGLEGFATVPPPPCGAG